MNFFAMKAASSAFALAAGLSVTACTAQSAKPLAYVTNQDGGVTVIELDSLKAVGEIDIEAKAPRGIGITADGKYLLTANRDGGDVSVIDTATKKVVKHVPIGKNPEFVRVLDDHAYVSFEPSSKGGPPPKAGEPEKDDDDDDDDKTPAGIAIVSLKEMKVVKTITSGPETEGIEFSPDGKQLVVTNEGDNTVRVYSLPDGKELHNLDTHAMGDRPRGVKVSPDGQHYIVTLEYADKFLVLDRAFKPIKTVATGKGPYGVAFNRAGDRLLIASFKDKKLQVFDGKTYAPIQDVTVGERCWHFTYTPDDSKILVVCGRSNDVWVLNAKSYALEKKIPGNGLPWGIVTYPKAMGSLDAP